MLIKSIRILNFDDSLINQPRISRQDQAQIIDFREIGPKARLWMAKEIRNAVDERLKGSQKAAPTFLGSGDFHHITQILVKQFKDPLSVIIFDFHPDWDILPPRIACGSWVNQLLKQKNVLKCLLIGVSSSDISSGWIQSANLTSLRDNRLEIYPYAHKPSLVFLRRIPANASITFRRGFLSSRIYWHQLKEKDLKGFFFSLLKRIPTKQVYVSIDKDCLQGEYALTNWETGLFSLEELLLMLRLIKEEMDIVGLDITGDYSQACGIRGFKSFVSKLDHPKAIAAEKLSSALVNATNEETNLKILELL